MIGINQGEKMEWNLSDGQLSFNATVPAGMRVSLHSVVRILSWTIIRYLESDRARARV